jgi:hypothetical protein
MARKKTPTEIAAAAEAERIAGYMEEAERNAAEAADLVVDETDDSESGDD